MVQRSNFAAMKELTIKKVETKHENAGLEFMDIQPFIAYNKKGDVVGRIAGIINHHANDN